jgi:hypothetical protein
MEQNTNSPCFSTRPYHNFNKLLKSLLFLLISCNSIEKKEKLDHDKTIRFTAKEIYKSNVFNTVTVLTDGGIGSGFFIDSNKVVTNYHVIAGMNNVDIMLNNSDKRFPVIGYLSVDKMNDLVLLQVDYNNNSWISIESTPPQPGENIFAIGSPVGLSKTITEGIVSSIRNFKDKKLLQITTPISHGSSGSPILNESGKLVGVAVGGIEEGNNIGFCIPSTLVNSLIDFREQYTRSMDQLASSETKSVKEAEPPRSHENSSSLSSESPIDYDKVFTVVQIPAEFPGGLSGWTSYLERNLNRDIPVENGAPPGRYTVIVAFTVSKTGAISDVQAENDPGYGTKAEAIRVITRGPSWKPAVLNGRNVIYRHKQSITFVVSEE